MAQDFGDDAGEMFLRHLKTAGKWMGKELWHHYKAQEQVQNPMPDQRISAPEYLCVPFGNRDDTTQLLSLCQHHGIDTIGLSDKNGNGYLVFHHQDTERLAALIPSFVQTHNIHMGDVISRSHNIQSMRETDILQQCSPIPVHQPTTMEIPKEAVLNRTEAIADKVRYAQTHSISMNDFRQRLAKDGIGIAASAQGDNLFYEARRAPDGSLLPYSHDKRDWAVTAETLKAKYGVDATHDGLEQTFKDADGSLDMRGETADINQGIESHDSMDTNTSTLRQEREGSGTDVAPSLTQKNGSVYHQNRVKDQAKISTASKELRDKDRGMSTKDIMKDISNKFTPER